MKNIKLIVEYDGTNYCGWQRQRNNSTVQQTIEEAINEITGEQVKLIGCSRTDSGVHAKMYVCNFSTNSTIPPDKMGIVINHRLPEDIVILNSEEVDSSFHSRYCSKGKMYSYTILNRSERAAIGRNYAYQYSRNIDIEAMRKASVYFLGKHDFSAFKSTGSSVKDNIRTIMQIKVEKDGDYIKIYVAGDGFLYNMVRIIVGTLLLVGEKKISPHYIEEIIESKDRNKAGKVVPARGLCLEKVFY
ncbi:tRNA pseudouridine(38-40) synthase TruA [Clostridium neuense]|uniref:tRNA pseudouridine synthase A n=1 Tax=Clostridium neuense TaxID=1728934 RepID=A0ABW8TB51_9CLOT